MDGQAQDPGTRLRKIIQSERTISGQRFLVSDNVDLISIDFVREAFATEAMWWATPFDPETTKFMLQNSESFGLYRIEDQPLLDGQPPQPQHHHLEQIGIARWVTDRVTYAWLSDVYILPEYQGMGHGKWLMQACRKYIDSLPGLRRAMTMTSNHERGIPLYTKTLGMHMVENEPGEGLVVLGTKKKTSDE